MRPLRNGGDGMINLLRNLRLCWDLWRMEGYDGEPTTLRHAWEIAGLPRWWRSSR